MIESSKFQIPNSKSGIAAIVPASPGTWNLELGTSFSPSQELRQPQQIIRQAMQIIHHVLRGGLQREAEYRQSADDAERKAQDEDVHLRHRAAQHREHQRD